MVAELRGGSQVADLHVEPDLALAALRVLHGSGLLERPVGASDRLRQRRLVPRKQSAADHISVACIFRRLTLRQLHT